MAQRTNNKIFFCWACMGPLTGDKTMFCDEHCAARYGKQQSARDLGKEKIEVYLNKSMLDLCRGEKVMPHEFSGFIHTGHDMVGIAVFDEAELETIGDAVAGTYDGYWRGINRLNTSFEELSSGERRAGHPHQPRKMREVGILSYLCDEYGISTEKNIAAAIGELVVEEGLKDAIELFNSL